MTHCSRARTLIGLIAVMAGVSAPFVAGSVVNADPSPASASPAERLELLRSVHARSGANAEAAQAESIDGNASPMSGGITAIPEGIATCLDSPVDAVWAYGDITSCGASLGAGNVVLAVIVDTYESPFSPSWEFRETGIFWDIDVTGDGVLDYWVGYINIDGTVVSDVFDAADNHLCAATVGYSPADNGYASGFPASCIGSPSGFLFGADMLYQDYATNVDSFDRAPDSTWAGPVLDDAPVPPPAGASLVSVVPARVLDTRPGNPTVDGQYQGTGRIGAGGTADVAVAGRGNVPADASAVMLNVTAVSPDGSGFLTVYPCGSTRPLASNVNFVAGQVVPNAVLAKLGAGRVCVFTTATVDIVIDVNGYVPANSALVSVVPARLLDTRPGNLTVDGQFQGTGRIGAGGTAEVAVLGRGGVSGDAGAVMLNVTAVSPDGSGFLTVYPCGAPRPLASNVNFVAGQVVPNAVLAKTGTGRVCVYTTATVDIVVDVNGYAPLGASLNSVVPARLLDTRPGSPTVDGQFQGTGRVGAGGTADVVVAGRSNVPGDATAAILNVTAVAPDGPGFLTVYPCGSSRPLASNVNFVAGQVVPNAVLAKLGNGRVCVYASATVDIVIDVNGYV